MPIDSSGALKLITSRSLSFNERSEENKDNRWTQFNQARGRFTIGSLDTPSTDFTVVAQYNPKELQIDKEIPWGEHQRLGALHSSKSRKDALLHRGQYHLEYTGAKARTMSIELFFDGYESRQSIQPQIRILETLSTSRDATSQDEHLRRPHHCVVTWGNETIPKFLCVIESLQVKYTMFSADGHPLRGTCTVKLKEATMLSTSKDEKDNFNG